MAKLDPQRILIEDEHLLALRKEAGELVVADRWGKEENILLHRVGDYLREKGHLPDKSGRDLYPVHRLDRETTGIVLFAKNQEAHRVLGKMFEERKVKKVYWTFTAGNPAWDKCTCSVPLTRAEGKKGRGRALVDLKKGKEAVTEFALLEAWDDVCWMEARPHTGRLHQIRIHLMSLGVPILFDPAYGSDAWESKFHQNLSSPRHFLHAREITFLHPFTGKEVKIECPMDEMMRTFFNRLKNGASLSY